MKFFLKAACEKAHFSRKIIHSQINPDADAARVFYSIQSSVAGIFITEMKKNIYKIAV